MNSLDVIILNRNLRKVTESLAETLRSFGEVRGVYVVDAGSSASEVATDTFARDDSPEAMSRGLRLNRGYNLGLSKWIELGHSDADWVLLLPNDAELIVGDFSRLFSVVEPIEQVAAIVPTSEDNPYGSLIASNGVSLGWLFYEGPIFLRASYVRFRRAIGSEMFDNSNFRSFSSFLELAFQIYSANMSVAVTNLVSFSENNQYLIGQHDLIGTEPFDTNLQLFLKEGSDWLAKKYGFADRRNLENITRLLFDEFIATNPDINLSPAR